MESIISQKSHDFLDIFLKKKPDTLLLHQKYDHKIYLEEDQKLNHISLDKISLQKLDGVK